MGVSKPLPISSVLASRLPYLHNPRTSRSAWASLLHLIPTSRGGSGCSCHQRSPGPGRGSAANSRFGSPASFPGTGSCAAPSSKGWTLAESFEAEIVAWVGPGLCWVVFFLLPRISVSTGIHLSQELPSAKREKKKQTKDTLPEQGDFLSLTVSP